MLFSRMVGGLGNQLFQTAALLKYRRHKEKVIISFLGDIHIRAANIIAIIANSNFPSNANLIDDKPIQTPIRVSMLGKITLALVFLSVTIFKLFFGCSIN